MYFEVVFKWSRNFKQSLSFIRDLQVLFCGFQAIIEMTKRGIQIYIQCACSQAKYFKVLRRPFKKNHTLKSY